MIEYNQKADQLKEDQEQDQKEKDR